MIWFMKNGKLNANISKDNTSTQFFTNDAMLLFIFSDSP